MVKARAIVDAAPRMTEMRAPRRSVVLRYTLEFFDGWA